MKKLPIISIILLGILSLSFGIDRAFSLYELSNGTRTIHFEGEVASTEYYLKGSFNNWQQQAGYKLTDVTSSMTPETNKVKEYCISGVEIKKDQVFKVHDTNNVWHSTYEHVWSNSISYDGDGNYKALTTSTNYTIYLKLYNNDTSKLYITAEKILYLQPNANWLSDSCRFAAYFFNNSGDTWRDMVAADASGIYKVSIPSGYSKVIFCRMDGSNSANNWGNKRNQTGDLDIPANNSINNFLPIPSGAWDGTGNGSWTVR